MADEKPTTEWRIPAAAAGAIQLSARLAQPAAWAMRLADRGRPPLVGAFGAQLADRFHTFSAPSTLALRFAERFLPSESQASDSDLPLANQRGVQRVADPGRWRPATAPASLTARLAASPPAAVATPGAGLNLPTAGTPEPLLGELTAIGWGHPGLAAPPPQPPAATTPPAEGAPGEMQPRVARQHADARPIQQADGAIRHTDVAPRPETQVARAAAEAVRPLPDQASPASSQAIEAPVARSVQRAPEDVSATESERPARMASSGAWSPDLLTLRPAALRPTTIMRTPPPDVLQRMGYAPLTIAAPSPERHVAQPSLDMPTPRAIRRQARAGERPARPAIPPASPTAAQRTSIRRNPVAPEIRPNPELTPSDAVSASATSPGEMPEPLAQPSAAQPEPGPASPSISDEPAPPADAQTTMEARPAEAERAPAITQPAEDAPASLPREPVSATVPSVSPLFLTTTILQRHYSRTADASGPPLVLLRTTPPTTMAQRMPPGGSEAKDFGATAGAGEALGISTAARTASENLDAGSSAQHVAAEPPALGPIGNRSAGPATTSAVATSESSADEPSVWDEPRAIETNQAGPMFSWGLPPLLQRSATAYAMAAQLGAQPLLRRSPALQPIATAAAASPHEMAGVSTAPVAGQNASTQIWRQADDLSSLPGRFAQRPRGDTPAAPGQPAGMAGSGWTDRAAQRAIDSGDSGWPAITGESDAEPGSGWLPEQRLGVGPAPSPSLDSWESPDLAFAPQSRALRPPDGPAIRRAASEPANGPAASSYAGALPALELAQPRSVQRAISDDTAVPTSAAAAPGATAAGPLDGVPGHSQAAINIEEIARKVYDHLRRRILIDHERRGRPL